MGLLTEIINKTQQVPLPVLLKERLKITARNKDDAELEREALLVKIEKLTASNKALMEVAELDSDPHADKLSDQELEIVQLMSQETVVSAREVCEAFGYNLARAEYLLSGLMENGYIVDSLMLGRHSYLLDSRGRAYLATLEAK